MPARTILAMGRRVLIVGLVILFALSLPTLLTKAEAREPDPAGRSGFEVAATMTLGYIAGPIAGFNYILATPGVLRDQPNNTFADLLSHLRQIGLAYTPPPNFDPFLPVPFLINAFTAYKAFYVDFGAFGCLIALFIAGVPCGSVFAAALRGNLFAKFAFCYVGFALAFSPFQNSFILFNRYTYVALFGIAYFVIIPRCPRFVLFRRLPASK